MTDAPQNPTAGEPPADDTDLHASATADGSDTTANTDAAGADAPAGAAGFTDGAGAAPAGSAGADTDAPADAEENLTIEDKLLAKVQELTEDVQRVTAEFANYRKRVQRDLDASRERGKAGVISALLALADDVEHARQHGDITEGSPLKAFTDKFSAILEGQGVAQFGEVGELFDANRHSAIQDEGGDGEKILSVVLRKGFTLGDRVLREAMVIVRGDEGAAAAPADGDSTGDDTGNPADSTGDSTGDGDPADTSAPRDSANGDPATEAGA